MLSVGHYVDVVKIFAGIRAFRVGDLLNNFFYRWVTALGVGVVYCLRDIALRWSGRWVKVVGELWELIEAGPSRSPFCQVAAVFLKVAPTDVERKEARDDGVWVVWGTDCEPARGIELPISVESIDDERRPPELSDHRRFEEQGDDVKKTLGAEDPGRMFLVSSHEWR